MEKTHLIEYGKECELLEKTNEGYKVRIYGKDEIIEKLVKYEPVKNEYKYDGILVEKNGTYSRLKKYTTYLKANVLVYAYKKYDIKRYSNDMVYETEIGIDYKIVENSPFLSEEKLNEEIKNCNNEKRPLLDKIKSLKKELEKEIEVSETKIKEINKKYDIDNKCEHKWEENGKEEYNEGKSTKMFYVCAICEKEDTHYWHKLF